MILLRDVLFLKPEYLLEINPAHPLARGLLWYTVDQGSVTRLLTNRAATAGTFLGTQPPFNTGPLGRGYEYTTTGTQRWATTDAAKPVGARSWACGVYRTGAVGGNARPFNRTANNGNAAPYMNYNFEVNKSSNSEILNANTFTTGTSFISTPNHTGLTANAPHTLLATARTGGEFILYFDGLRRTAISAGANLGSFTTGDAMLIGGSSDTSAVASSWVGFVPWSAVWDRELSAYEARLLHMDPYCFLRGSQHRISFPVAGGSVTLQPTSISSAEAIGTHGIIYELRPLAIAPSEILGTPQLDYQLAPAAIGSAAAVGTPALAFELRPVGFTSPEALGVLALTYELSPVGIASDGAMGTPNLDGSLVLQPTSISPSEALGSPGLVYELRPAAIGTSEVIGTPQLDYQLSPAAIDSATAVSAPSLTFELRAVGVESREVVPAPGIVYELRPSGIASESAFGSPALGLGGALVIIPVGIQSAGAIGTPAIQIVHSGTKTNHLRVVASQCLARVTPSATALATQYKTDARVRNYG